MVTDTLTGHVAERVRRAMLEAGHNPHSLAEAAGIARTTLIRNLKGSQPFDVRELGLIANALGYANVLPFFMQDAA